MNPIKFRCWDTGLRKFLNSSVNNIQFLRTYLDVVDWSDHGFATFSIEESGTILQQFTGLCDWNGKEIYEGDILKCEVNSKEVIAVVTYSLDVYNFGFRTENLKIEGWEYSEIIGNIYETPDLIKN